MGQSKANTAAERRKRVGLVFFLFRRLAQSGAVCWDAGLCEHVSLSRRRRVGAARTDRADWVFLLAGNRHPSINFIGSE